MAADRVGIGWRAELAAGIFVHRDRIDCIELIADDHFRASKRELRALRTLAGQVPMSLHGVTAGLASMAAADEQRLTRMARLAEAVQPESWSEHLAFVRAGGIEIGHLAAPPRTEAGIEAAARNTRRATAIVGAAPAMENVATLIDPPASTLDEPDWIAGIVAGADAPLLLDLHNLYANAVNFGADPAAMLLRLPLDRVKSVHLSGGHWIEAPGSAERRLLDDHVHDVPPEVFALLTLLATHAPQPLDVILERDGNYPAFPRLLLQLDAARTALAAGRAAMTMRAVA
ncbi:DUF692 family multinuclear iron-containing protein [Dongia sp.]|uniref:DUF692 domain-containing protein n=1 Tax=Dongia sp. TaxID=1977262 RepID=UPI003750FF99